MTCLPVVIISEEDVFPVETRLQLDLFTPPCTQAEPAQVTKNIKYYVLAIIVLWFKLESSHYSCSPTSWHNEVFRILPHMFQTERYKALTSHIR